MKRRAFLSRSALGLSALAVGARGILKADDGKRRIYGIPDSVRPRPPMEEDLLRLSLARTDLPVEAWRDVAALSRLAQDVFDNPAVAAAFTRHPEGYLKAVGLDDVRLDPATTEVKVALALGDPEVRAAIERDDPEHFLRALEARGLIRDAEPSQIASRIEAQFRALETQGETPSPESCTAVAICLAAVWIWVAVIQDVTVAVNVAAAVNVYAYALVYTKTVASGRRRKAGREVLPNEPSVKVAGLLGGPDFAGRVGDRFVEENVEKVARAVESLDIYRDSGEADAAKLRDHLRAGIHRQIRGDAPFLPGVRA